MRLMGGVFSSFVPRVILALRKMRRIESTRPRPTPGILSFFAPLVDYFFRSALQVAAPLIDQIISL